MAAVDPISQCVACQFNIEYDLFNFEIDFPWQPPTLPGLGNLVLAVLEGIVETVLFFIKPLTWILEGKIPDLLDWISTAMSGPEEFILEAINLAIVDPYTSKLQVSTPPTTLPVPGIPDVPIPAINPGKPGFADNPQWLFQVPAFFKFLFSILLLPIKLLIKIFITLVTRMKFPPLNKKTFKKIWSEIVPDLGLPSIDSANLMIKFGGCLMDQVEKVIPPPAPLDGASPSSNPPNVQVFFDPAGVNKEIFHDTELLLPAGTPFNKIIRVQRNGTDYSFDSVKTQVAFGTPNDFIVDPSGFSVTFPTPLTHDIPVQYTAATPKPGISGCTVILNRGTNDPFYFFLVSGRKNSYDLLREAYTTYGKIYPLDDQALRNLSTDPLTTNINYVNPATKAYLNQIYEDYADPWDPHFNIFGIRKEHAPTDVYEDILGCAYNWGTVQSPNWKIYAWKATTRPGAYYRNLHAKDDVRKGAATFLPGFHPVPWKVGIHNVSTPQIDALTMFDPSPTTFSWCSGFSDLDKTCKPDNNRAFQWNLSMNNHHPSENYTEAQSNRGIVHASAGCQVLQSKNSFLTEYKPLYLAKRNLVGAERNGGIYKGRYSYLLLMKDNVEDLWNAISPYDQPNASTRRWPPDGQGKNGGLVVDPPI